MEIPFVPAGNDLNNREMAIAGWIVVLSVFLLSNGGLRSSIAPLVKALGQRLLLLSMAALLAWVILVTTAGWRVGLWGSDLVKDTAIWFFTFALVRLFRLTNVGKEQHLFRDMVLDPITAAAAVEFIANLYTFPLLVEFILVPIATTLGLLAVVAGYRNQRAVKNTANGLLGAIGLIIIGFSVWQIAGNWSRIGLPHQFRLFGLPIWLTVGTVPYLYFMSLLAGYESMFLRVAFASPGRRITMRSRLALASVLTLRTRAVAGFGAPWIWRLAEAEDLREARNVVHDYLLKSQTTRQRP